MYTYIYIYGVYIYTDKYLHLYISISKNIYGENMVYRKMNLDMYFIYKRYIYI